jgi:hypothetical protein
MLPQQRNEAEIERAISYTRKVLNAAENSNQGGEDLILVMASGPELYRRVVELEDLLDRCAEFLDGQVDVVDGDYGQPEPNKAMRLVSEIREIVPAA